MKSRSPCSALLIALGLVSVSAAAADAPLDPKAIVEQADTIRFPNAPFQVSVKVTTVGRGGSAELHEYQVLQKGYQNSIVRTLSPATEKGQVMLLKGSDLWVFLPGVSQPVRLPLAQRLTGQVANGDLARANFSGDYEAKVLRTESIENQSYLVLELTAARKGVTYERVLYWVNASSKRPFKAEFYTLSGRLMKTGFYDNYKELGGAQRPTRLTLKDALHAGEESVLEYSGLKLREIPDKFFTKEFLRKLD